MDVTRLVACSSLRTLQLAPAATGFLLTSTLLFSTSGVAYEFELADGEVQGTLNTTISVGTKYDLKGYETPDGLEQNENDGDRSFDGGFVSKALKLTSELELKKDNYGAFVRGTAYYDHVLMKGNNKWSDNNADDVAKGRLNEAGTFSGWSDEVKDNQGRGAKFQSAYVFGSWAFDGGQTLDIRAGDQVHNWGETIFYGSGLMGLNAFDGALASLPGSDGDLKLAQGMVQADFAFNEQMSLSGFVQYRSKESIMPGRATFGSETDLFVPGSDYGYKDIEGFAESFNKAAGRTVFTPDGLAKAMQATGTTLASGGDFIRVADTSGTGSASDSGQWGLKLTFEPEFLEDTQFALYYANHHATIPVIDIDIAPEAAQAAAAAVEGVDLGFGAPLSVGSPSGPIQQISGYLAGLHILNNGTYASTAYPEDINLWGASFNTKVFGYTQIAGEVTYQKDYPIWIDHPDDLIAKILANAGSALATGSWDSSQADPYKRATLGQTYQNYEMIDLWDASLSVIQPFGAVMGTDLMYLVAEAAVQQVSGLDNYDRYIGKDSEAWYGEDPDKNADDRLDRFSWGYNLMLGANWEDVYTKGLKLESTVRFTHDVKGNSHFTGRFEEGEKKLNMGLAAKYDNVVAKFSWQGDAHNLLRKGVIVGSLGYTF